MTNACSDNFNSSIPDYAVYIERNINLEALDLRTIGGYKTYTTIEEYGDAIGYGGVMVIYGFNENYYAFDMACPYEINRGIRVRPNSAGTAVCDSCGSVFSIGYGSGNRLSGPAKEGLKRYHISVYQTVSGNVFQVTR
jgi:nitrite reductase/ring-hydroxylating ferredoxin subunit